MVKSHKGFSGWSPVTGSEGLRGSVNRISSLVANWGSPYGTSSLFIAPQALLENVFEKARRRRLFRLRTREDWAEVQGPGSPINELSAPGASFKRLRDPSGSSPKMCVVVCCVMSKEISPLFAATFRALLSRVQGGEGHLGR